MGRYSQEMEHKDYSGAIRWQADHGISHALTARLFGRYESSIPVIAWRDANRLIPHKVEDILHDTSAAGMAADQLLKDVKIEKDDLEVPLKLTELEQQIDAFGRHFWEKVRDHEGAKELGLLLRKVSRPSWENLALRRAAAKLYHLLAEIYLHAGCCRSSLKFGVKAYRAEEELYKETLSKDELFSIGKTSLLFHRHLSIGANSLMLCRGSIEAGRPLKPVPIKSTRSTISSLPPSSSMAMR
ncbi:MAG: hypothetical protein ACJ71U_15430 [Terriglobales bacterium]